MTDLAETFELPAEVLTADALIARAIAEIKDLRHHRDAETTALKLAALCQSAAVSLRHMEESHAGSPDLADAARGSDPRAARDALGWAIGGGWRATRPTKTSLRPH